LSVASSWILDNKTLFLGKLSLQWSKAHEYKKFHEFARSLVAKKEKPVRTSENSIDHKI
jgi:hypothetical protein